MPPSHLLEPPRPARSPWQLAYAAGHHLRRAWYARRARRLPRPVISVGNLHWGGSGKTPITAAIAGHLRDRGVAVAILTRGYRSRGSGVRVVSTGDGPLLGPLVAGDEPVLLAGELPGVAVVVSPDRYQAGVHALERLQPSPEVMLLDDGFSHLRLHRDIDLLVMPCTDPYGGGRLYPGGRLREPLSAAARADGVLLTGSRDGGEELAAGLAGFGFAGRGFASETIVADALLEPGRLLPTGARVVLVAGIASPERVRESAVGLGYDIAEFLAFSDHHAYSDQDLDEIGAAVERSGATCVLATGKDQVKLLGRLEVPLAVLPLRAHPEPAFFDWLDERLATVGGPST